MLNSYRILVVAFFVTNKVNRVKLFKETFLVANISPKIVFKMLFLTLSNVNVDFLGQELRWKTYTTKKALLIIRHVKLVGKIEFAIVALDSEYETYIVHINSVSSIVLPSSSLLDVYLSRRLWIAGLIVEKASTKIFDKYSNFADVFFPDLASKLSEYTKINDHAIKPVHSQQPPYEPIYSLGLVKLETLKAYIGTNLINSFIKLFKSPISASILFDRKLNSFF